MIWPGRETTVRSNLILPLQGARGDRGAGRGRRYVYGCEVRRRQRDSVAEPPQSEALSELESLERGIKRRRMGE